MVDKSEKFNWLVRVGYFSRAILYSVLGLIALTSAQQIAQAPMVSSRQSRTIRLAR